MRNAGLLTRATLIGVFCAASAQATPIMTSLPGGVVVPMPDRGDVPGAYSLGPETFLGVTWTTTSGQSLFGYTGARGYGFVLNGFWDNSVGPMAGLNDTNGTMTFAFEHPVSGVGGFINYVPFLGPDSTIAIYDSATNLLESTLLSFQTDGSQNSGLFLGFQRDSPDIAYFTLSENYIGITDLTVAGGAVPEPGTLMLLGAGIVGVAARRRRAQ